MTDIQAIKKAAEAYKSVRDRYATGELLNNEVFREQRLEYRDALGDPATVLELCDGYRAWQPIETAPKDGTHILTHGHGITVETKWIDTVDGGWCLVNQDVFAWQGGLRTLNPKYWMPLPEPPK